MKRITLTAGALALACMPAAAFAAGPATLTGRAVLPAQTFAGGPPSGSAISPANGVTPPFAAQPVQGFSGGLDRGDGSFLLMPDNGYGAKANSADFNLRVYTVRPAFRTASAGAGTVAVEDHVDLRDPQRLAGFPIVNAAQPGRRLTGADFDVESIQRGNDGSLWIGDELGPFVLHFTADGRLADAPFPIPGVESDSNPFIAPGTGNLPNSRGLEGMALSPDGRYLYPMLEGALKTDAAPRLTLRMYRFDTVSKAFTGDTFRYRMSAEGNSLGDLQMINDHQMLIIERDNAQGPAAAFKKLFLLDLRQTDAQGFLVKTEVADLLDIADPAGISTAAPAPRPGDFGLGNPFRMPFQTIETIVPLPGGELLIADDNNFPFSAGRNPGLPDDDEIITIRPADALRVDPLVLGRAPVVSARETLIDAARDAEGGAADRALAGAREALALVETAGDRLGPRERLRSARRDVQRAIDLLQEDERGDDAADELLEARRHLAGLLPGPRPGARRLAVAIIGDTPYDAAQAARFPALADSINADPQVQAVVHVGDVKSGGSACADAVYADTLARLALVRKPIAYTPGDNEWTDCHRTGSVPSERLAHLRSVFFPLGRLSPTLGGGASFVPDRQSDAYPENARFRVGGVTVALVHAVGSNNNLYDFTPAPAPAVVADAAAEYPGRNQANVSWIRDTFRAARGTRAVVIAMQGNPGWGQFPSDPPPTGFADLLGELRRQARAYGRPVVVVHGDSHVHRMDRPWADVPNLVRVENFGSPNAHWTRLVIDPRTPEVVTAVERLVPGSPLTSPLYPLP